MKLCLIESCDDHRDDDAWVHLVPKRDTPVTAHLWPMTKAVA